MFSRVPRFSLAEKRSQGVESGDGVSIEKSPPPPPSQNGVGNGGDEEEPGSLAIAQVFIQCRTRERRGSSTDMKTPKIGARLGHLPLGELEAFSLLVGIQHMRERPRLHFTFFSRVPCSIHRSRPAPYVAVWGNAQSGLPPLRAAGEQVIRRLLMQQEEEETLLRFTRLPNWRRQAGMGGRDGGGGGGSLDITSR